MKGWLLKTTIISFAVGAYVGCSPVRFSLDPSPCEEAGTCIVENGKYSFNELKTVGGGKVDILIVNDNSASMSFEQRNLANRFQGFIQSLDSRSIDYRIAMTTTDIHVAGDNNEPRDINGQGARQNGNLVSFNGYAYLTPAVADRVNLFNQTVVRPETLQCEQFIANWVRANGLQSTETSSVYMAQYKQNCPSGDERGVYAANLTVQKNPSSFIRKDAHLAIIFLADEDVRSHLYDRTTGYQLEALDQPASLIQNIYTQFGTGKGISVHAITVKDNACLAQQNDQTLGSPAEPLTRGFIRGTFGSVYLTFPEKSWGRAVDICFNDYTSQLGDITSHIFERISSVELKCSNPEDLQVELIPANAAITNWVDGNKVRFSQTLAVGTQVRTIYKCSSLN